MKLNPRIWVPVAQLLTGINVAAVYSGAQSAEPWHATLHAGLAVLFTVGIDWLRSRAQDS